MKARTFLIAFSFILVLSSQPTSAQDSCVALNVAAAEIPHFVENEREGVFVELIRTAAKRAGLDLTITVYPKKRALSLFQTGRMNALLPHSSAGVDVPSHKSTPILVKRDFAFVRAGTPAPKSISELEGLQIGLTKQYAYSDELTTNGKIAFSREPNSDLDNIKMLSVGRFDASIIEEHSGLKAIADAAADNIIYDRDHPINEFLVWILFANNDCGQKLSGKINAAFEAMKSDGTWDAIIPPPNSAS